MKTKCKRLFSLLLVFVLVLGLMPSVYAATDEGTQPTTEPAVTEAATETVGDTEPTVPETTGAAEATDPSESTEGTQATEAPTEAEEEETEPPEDSDEDWTQPPEDDGMTPEEWDLLRWAELEAQLPDPIEEYFPFAPEIKYPYGEPQDNFYPSSLLEGDNRPMMFAANPYAVAPLADMDAIPDEMYDNSILRALEYTGYDVQWLKDNGYLYVAEYVSSNINNYRPEVLSNIGYDDYSPFLNGDETESNSGTPTGKAPDIAKFEANGLVCASFVSYPDWAFDTTVRTLKVEVNTTKAVTFTNNQAGYAEIVKKTNTGGSLGGWKFNVYSDVDCTKPIAGSPFTTDTDGVITVKIAPGTYYVKEVDESASNPLWNYDTTTRKVVVKAGETGSVTFTNTHYGYGQIIKKTNTGGTLDGWKFNIYSDEACTKLVSGSPFTTNAQGLIAARLLPGTYWVKEVDESSKRPDWEFDTATRKLTVTAGNTSSVTFNNKHFGYAQIVKETSTGKDLAGWKFNIYKDEACTTLVDGSPFTSGEDGTIKVKLAPGTYWVQEIDESDENPDWTYDTTVRKVTVAAGDVARVTFTNTHFGYAEIQKATNTGKDLGGWKFEIYTDADCTQKVTGSPFTTDNEGKMSVRLLPGTYFVQEVDESAEHPDWVFDTKVHVVTVKAGETASVKLENKQMGRAKLIKAMPDGGPVSGWVFDIYRKSDNAHMGTFISGEDGTILTDYLLPDTYLVYEQLDEQSIYWCESENPQEVIIKAGETAEVTFTNRLKPGKISIQKVDITGEPLGGAEFLLEWSVDGTNWQPVSHTDSQYVTEGTCTSEGLVNGRLISDETGLVEFTGLHPERLYRLTETAAPEGYQLLADTAYEGGLPADKELTIQLTVVNVPTFELPKTGSKSLMLMPVALALAAAMCGAILYVSKRKEQ